MRRIMVILSLLALSLAGAAPAQAQMMDHCTHEPTVAALRQCVQHALDEGAIAPGGVATSLFAKLDAAEAALNRGDTSRAIRVLEALSSEVSAQAGRHIEHHHAEHLLAHVRHVIETLGES